MSSPLGETLRRARLTKGTTLEDAERVTRIPRKYLEALELENFGILPAPVYARGFLRSYAGYLGLDAGELLPFFPVGHVEEPKLESLPEVQNTRTWNANSVIAIGVVGVLILLVIGLYSIGREDSGSFPELASNTAGATTAGESAVALPDLAGQTLSSAIALVQETGAQYIVIGVREGDAPVDQVVDQSPAPGSAVGPGSVVTIKVSR